MPVPMISCIACWTGAVGNSTVVGNVCCSLFSREWADICGPLAATTTRSNSSYASSGWGVFAELNTVNYLFHVLFDVYGWLTLWTF